MRTDSVILVGMIFFVFTSCTENISETVPAQNVKGYKWLAEEDDEKFFQIEEQLRGFDIAMVEVGYRYQELYWAGIDQNWEYASYQLSKIQKTIELGVIRRPARKASSEDFLNRAIPQMESVIELKDSAGFFWEVESFTQACNTCHAKEKVPFFTVRLPLERQSPIRKL